MNQYFPWKLLTRQCNCVVRWGLGPSQGTNISKWEKDAEWAQATVSLPSLSPGPSSRVLLKQKGAVFWPGVPSQPCPVTVVPLELLSVCLWTLYALCADEGLRHSTGQLARLPRQAAGTLVRSVPLMKSSWGCRLMSPSDENQRRTCFMKFILPLYYTNTENKLIMKCAFVSCSFVLRSLQEKICKLKRKILIFRQYLRVIIFSIKREKNSHKGVFTWISDSASYYPCGFGQVINLSVL